MAGSGALQGFDAGAFRTAIRAAMTMSSPVTPSQQVTFVFSEVATYSPQDTDANPYDWTETPVTDVAARNVLIPAAVQYAVAPVQSSGILDFDATRVVLTVLDIDYVLVAGADVVLVGGIHYLIDPPGWIPLALFDVGVFQCHLTARG